MPVYRTSCKIFDPVRFTTSTEIPNFIVDTWFNHGLITQDLFTRLPGIPTLGTGRVEMSSGMATIRPRVEIGIQINNIRALPLSVYVVDTGPADLLLGGDFLKLLFDMGIEVPPGGPRATIEPPLKREKTSLALRLLSETEQFSIAEVEQFIGALKTIHNCSVIIERGMHQHEDWNSTDKDDAKRNAVERTIVRDAYLSENDRLQITWIESGSIWVTIKSGAKSGMGWLSKLFRLTMDAKLEKVMAEAATAKEKEEISRLTRDEIVNAKKAEARLRTAKALRQEREEWRKSVLGEIDFRQELCKKVKDKTVQEVVQRHLEKSIHDLGETHLYAMIEHSPDDPEINEHDLPSKGNSNSCHDKDSEQYE